MTQSLYGIAKKNTFILVPAALVCAVVLLGNGGFGVLRSTAQEARVVPPPVVDAGAAQQPSEVAILAGGCFWGVQGVYQHLKGVSNAVSGYAGGEMRNPTYRAVTTGTTGHAESVRVTFDPRQISYGRILQVFFSVVHDPTQLDRQGPDVGPQYRSAILPVNFEQARVAQAYIAQLNQARAFHAGIVTKIEPGQTFYPAEEYHQDFMTKNPNHPYIVYHDLPKIDDFKRLFPDLYRAEPVLVAKAGISH
jgi:peptide-methionine (S)-S-oxide reductase